MSYSDLLRDPRWQRKRLEIMQRDDFTCLECGDRTTTLNVHHTYYAKGRKPWEYENESLRTLCETCHADVSAILSELQRYAGALSREDLERVLGFVQATAIKEQWPEEWSRCDERTPRIPLTTDEQAAGVCTAMGISEAELSIVVPDDASSIGWAEYRDVFALRDQTRSGVAA